MGCIQCGSHWCICRCCSRSIRNPLGGVLNTQLAGAAKEPESQDEVHLGYLPVMMGVFCLCGMCKGDCLTDDLFDPDFCRPFLIP